MPYITKVFGAPGTGKTTWMLNQLEEEIKSGTDVRRIAYVTFSVAARQEAKNRALSRLPSIPDDHFKFFRTIHGICYVEVGMGRTHIMQADDYLDFARYCPIQFSDDFTDDFDIDGMPFGWSTSPGNRIMNIRQVASARMIDPFSDECINLDWPKDLSQKEVKHVLGKYDEYKQKQAKFDFVDLLHMYRNTQSPLPIDVMFVDEAQDLSSLQWDLVHKMSSSALRLYIAGDDDQSIYNFLGSNTFGFLDHHADRTIILDRTYRLKRRVWGYAKGIIERVGKRQPKEIMVDDGGSINWWGIPAEAALDRLPLDDVMVIGSTNYQLASLRSKLDAAGIPVEHKGRAITQTEEAKRFYFYHRARKGHEIPIQEAIRIARVLGLDIAKLWSDEARLAPQRKMARGELESAGIRFISDRTGCDYLGKSKRHLNANRSLYAIASKFGLEATIAKPRVKLETYHASKGREAKRVLLITDCSPTAMDYAVRDPDYERRLAYVGVTRTMEELHICRWQTDSYMRTFR